MKRIISILMVFFALTVGVKASDDKPISIEQLPKVAKEFLNTHFSNEKIAVIKMDKGFFDTDYEVLFSNGHEVKFNKDGEWEEVDCARSEVPVLIIPNEIKHYVIVNYPDRKVTHIEKKNKRNKSYEIELDDSIEISFDKNYVVVDIDF
ncbi:MAG: hypothetical protein GX905_04070 [Bacteroidales bacterium]|nr:hypothetical protein [Bacteroidales bacterium]